MGGERGEGELVSSSPPLNFCPTTPLFLRLVFSFKRFIPSNLSPFRHALLLSFPLLPKGGVHGVLRSACSPSTFTRLRKERRRERKASVRKSLSPAFFIFYFLCFARFSLRPTAGGSGSGNEATSLEFFEIDTSLSLLHGRPLFHFQRHFLAIVSITTFLFVYFTGQILSPELLFRQKHTRAHTLTQGGLFCFLLEKEEERL